MEHSTRVYKYGDDEPQYVYLAEDLEATHLIGGPEGVERRRDLAKNTPMMIGPTTDAQNELDDCCKSLEKEPYKKKQLKGKEFNVSKYSVQSNAQNMTEFWLFGQTETLKF